MSELNKKALLKNKATSLRRLKAPRLSYILIFDNKKNKIREKMKCFSLQRCPFFVFVLGLKQLYILFLSLSHTISLCKFYFFFLNKLLILDEERLIFSPLSLESWEEVLWSLYSLPMLRPSESREVRDG